MANPGPSNSALQNTVPLRSNNQFSQTIGVTMTPVAVATITVAEQSFGLNGVSFVTAATGILAGDVITAVSPPSTVAGVGISQFRVDAAVNDKFYISFVNPTAGSLTPPSGVWLITVQRTLQTTVGEISPPTLASWPTSITSN